MISLPEKVLSPQSIQKFLFLPGRFQEMNDLEADGYVGAKTWKVLFNQDAK